MDVWQKLLGSSSVARQIISGRFHVEVPWNQQLLIRGHVGHGGDCSRSNHLVLISTLAALVLDVVSVATLEMRMTGRI